ncbi:hypothetical protein BDN72DRAFT_776722 [Pluteus cervinus]|uniref:Uncharacterized protein n=1 Tax=Pluteus cervinus TaxID=181527 RepID=A0ACD3AA66_9AGAR|nr:hypothetical protein BDN72DRAFT_776722 [Pluteus cervinus]
MRLLGTTWLLAALSISANAHTFVHSVWVNGVDQGTGIGIRQPAYIGGPLPGPAENNNHCFRTAPVRDLNSIDMRCNVLGDTPNPYTIQVKPGDNVTFEWHHKYRGDDDEVIASSHKGAGLVYISPNPPTDRSWVKIQEEGQLPDGQWYIAGKHTQRHGKQDVAIPRNLAPGQYILRPELLTLHEADVSHLANVNRGVQIYISCIQIQVLGNGTLPLPPGVGFPGSFFFYSSPGIVYSLYTTPPLPPYPIPGPPVWSAAAPSPTISAYGTVKGVLTQTRWYTWIGTSFSTVTSRTMLTIATGASTITTPYTPYWPSTYATPATPVPSPDSANAVPGSAGTTIYVAPTAVPPRSAGTTTYVKPTAAP